MPSGRSFETAIPFLLTGPQVNGITLTEEFIIGGEAGHGGGPNTGVVLTFGGHLYRMVLGEVASVTRYRLEFSR